MPDDDEPGVVMSSNPAVITDADPSNPRSGLYDVEFTGIDLDGCFAIPLALERQFDCDISAELMLNGQISMHAFDAAGAPVKEGFGVHVVCPCEDPVPASK